ncbi:serine/threonine-protein kinase [Amycolatopsis suaedae]|uniref:non-specific serine/threonine protein kinase n=1 Tax=Amycolatopsis suaedae TaxID=2510978 RepID=A0A4Q7IZM9_9PSEU|nr:serine/threonine-protein kinase [Amycolatopsis suaedae]RZQ59888.1 serine/threonine protein kinase [Amycolatopsis suaedae]
MGPRVLADRYVLLGELGRGGMGVVWRAEDRVIGRHVAIKELRLPEGAADAGVFAERVLREVRTGGRLNDPAVVTVFDVLSEAGTTFIVMELVEAPTLSDLVRERGPLPAQQVAVIGEQVLSALKAAHDAGIVHRDVKPGNIMVAANGRVKLTDFGIAQAVDDPRLTTSGMLVGSPAFMAPERVSGHEATPASDLWSLGATLFFAAEGIVAFEKSSTAATLHAIVNEVPYLTHTRGPLASAIMGLLAAAPEGRLGAEQTRGLLRAASAGVGQQTPPGGAYTAVHTGPPPTMVTPGAPTGPRRRTPLVVAGVVVVVGLLAGAVFLGRWWGSAAAAPDPATAGQVMTYGRAGDIQSFSDPSSEYCYTELPRTGYSMSSDQRVDCDKPHRTEAIAEAAILGDSVSYDENPPLAAYPGMPRLTAWAQARCQLTFESNKIDKTAEGPLKLYVLVPTEQEWNATPAGSGSPVRSAYCLVARQDGGEMQRPVTGKVK